MNAMSRWLVFACIPAALSLGCKGVEGDAQAASATAVAAPLASASPASVTDEVGSCQRRIEALKAETPVPGAPDFEKRRHQILGRAKAEPVLLKRAPRFGPASSKEVENYRNMLKTSRNAGYTLYSLWRVVSNRPALLRQLVLPEGYLYSEDPTLAAAIANRVELHHLFDSPELFIQRGGQILRAVKTKSRHYEYADGHEVGKRARILLLDRIAPTRAGLAEPLHVDVRSVLHREGFDRFRLTHFGETQVAAELRYGGVWVPALFSLKGAQLTLECSEVRPWEEQVLEHNRSLIRRRRRAFQRVQAAIVQQAEEALPFDEPKTEEGQQDGNLRPAWIWAYKQGWESYTFNDDGYMVFDSQGRPMIPQVCIDFVTDSFERAGGTWWAPKSQERARTEGLVDFDKVDIENRRSVQVFVKYAWANPEHFDVYDLRPEERVVFYQRDSFFEHLFEHRDRYQVGDIIVILGPGRDGDMHWHSFFVYEADPLSGMPTILAGNAGKPRIRTWENVMRSAPRRSIKHRIRPRLEWLESVVHPKAEAVSAQEPPPLTSAPI